MSRNVCVVTGSRAEYGLLKPIMTAISAAPSLNLQLVVTGMHLDPTVGLTVREIESDGWRIDARVPILDDREDDAYMARAIARSIHGCADAFQKLHSHIVLVLGDRFEIMGPAIGALYSQRILAHVHGGDVSAGLDEFTRHAVTKMAHIHFAATERSASRIQKMGEEPERIHVVGAPGLDSILNDNLPSEADVRKRYGIPAGPFLLFVMHPVSTSPAESNNEILKAIDGTLSAGLPVLALFSNLDPGGRSMIAALKARSSDLILRASIPHADYLALLRACSALVGNSSSGIIEAPSFGIPVVNIGQRQRGRERGRNVCDVQSNPDEVRKAIKRCLNDTNLLNVVRQRQNPYGVGDAGRRIAEVLRELSIDETLRSKHITY